MGKEESELKRKRVLVINHFGTNKGDAAILIGLVDILRGSVPHLKLSVISTEPAVDGRYFRQDEVKLLKRIFRARRETKESVARWALQVSLWMLQSTIWALSKRCSNGIRLCIDSRKRELLQEYADADIVVSCGGGYLNDSFGLMLLAPLHDILIALIIKKPVYLLAQSIGPFNSALWKFIAKNTLNRVQVITLREGVSKKVLRDIAIDKPPIYVTADPAFVLNSERAERVAEIMHNEHVGKGRHPLVGVTLHYWHYPGAPHPEAKHAQYKEAMAQAADYLAKELGATVVFIPMNIKNSFYDERPLAREIIGLMNYKNYVRVIEGEYTPRELTGIIGQMDYIIGTRFHSVILAFRMGVPALTIMYEHKAEGIMKMLGLERFVCDINEIDAEELISKINDLTMEREQVIETLEQNVALLQKLALLNGKFASLILESSKVQKKPSISSGLNQEDNELLQKFN